MKPSLARPHLVLFAAVFALVIAACGSDADTSSDDATVPSDTTDSADSPDEPEPESSGSDDSGGSAAGLPRVAVGGTFAIEAIGSFDATYLGLADLGVTTTLSGEDVQCYAILGEVTLISEGDIEGPALSPQRADAVDATGAAIDTNNNAECPQSATTDAGFTGAFNVDWTEGAAVMISFDIVSIPVGVVDQLDHIQISPATPTVELEPTVTETL